MVSDCYMTMLRHTKRLFKRISETGKGCQASSPIRQILPLVPLSHFQGSKTLCWCDKISVRLFFSVWTVNLEKIMKTHFEIGLKDKHFVYHMVVSILKDWDNYFGTVCEALLWDSYIYIWTPLVKDGFNFNVFLFFIHTKTYRVILRSNVLKQEVKWWSCTKNIVNPYFYVLAEYYIKRVSVVLFKKFNKFRIETNLIVLSHIVNLIKNCSQLTKSFFRWRAYRVMLTSAPLLLFVYNTNSVKLLLH
jgi:hypothetical protein